MRSTINTIRRRLSTCLAGFRRDEGGQILIVFALSSLAIFAGLGAGVDLAGAYAARQRLSQVATLACQYSTRPSVAATAAATFNGTNGFQTYVNAVNAFAAANLTAQHWTNATPTGANGTAGTYFTATPAIGGSTAAANVPTVPVVEMNASVPTNFGQILNITSIPVHTRIACQTLDIVPQLVNAPVMLQEGFEKPCTDIQGGGFCSTPAVGTRYTTTPLNSFPSTPQFVYGGRSWYIMGYCLETDTVGTISPTVPEGSHSAELDCDNGQGTAGNSSMSTKLYFEAGSYEIRYFFRSRIDYPDYDPAYICGSTAADTSFATSTNAVGGPRANVSRSNQINVYFDMNNGSSPPTHTTLDGTQTLAGSNLVDQCVHSITWIERSVRLTVTTPAYYWLSLAADGANDSYGGQIDNIRVCQGVCTGTPNDNFPSAWASGQTLFQDTFNLPIYLANASQPLRATNGNPSLSTGTSGTFASGWPGLAASGWQAAPSNQMTYAMAEAGHPSQFIWLDGSGGSSTNRIISRQFLLDPGYYQVSYDYVAEFTGYYGTTAICSDAPGSGLIYPSNATTAVSGSVRDTSLTTTKNGDTNIVGAFMSDVAAVSVPNGKTVGSSPYTAAQGQQSGYFNPGNTSTSVATPNSATTPDTVNWQNYNAAQLNPLLSTCAYAPNWTTRTVNIKITKPGMYLLSFSNQTSTADGYGAGLDNITLAALGSPYMANPPASTLVTIPNAATTPGGTTIPASDTKETFGNYSGFSITASPFTPPAAAPTP